MRKLKLQMQLSVNGYCAGPNGEMDWLTWNWTDDIKNYVTDINKNVDTIVMGRKLAEGFIPHWTDAAQKPDADEFTHKMVDLPKVVFSKTLTASPWENTVTAGDLVAEIKKLKETDGGDIMTYGGADYASALIKANLVDDYHLFINPAAVGNGLPIFQSLDSKLGLKLVKAQAFEVGIVVLHYQPE
ncbi:dihydrofolate reductase family protein [Mucilaginibacter antarcticus]|uniref:Dihydrofolate reductase family protein n=1 Tax=Mucilaginibacter antarcticus TaxID=1855725 RepID=A0ABW5XRM4_9SPHI